MKQEATKLSAMGFMLLSAVFASAGQILFKFAANATMNMATFVFNPYIYSGGIAYVVGVFFMIKALRRGELSVVYPVLATSFIWVSLASPLFFRADFMTMQKWVGVVIIILGVTLVGKGRLK